MPLQICTAQTKNIAPPQPRLLLVDDQPNNIMVLYRILADDYQITMANSGEQALATCLSRSIDLILLNVAMPDIAGDEICLRLKANPLTRDIPVIFITTHHDEAAETRSLAAGAVDFIAQPITPGRLRTRVKTYITLKTQSDFLHNLSCIDGLTGIHNRTYFEQQLASEVARAVRNDTVLSVIMINIDQFKHFNDRYGHLAGDDCLVQIANTTKTTLKRQTDLVARYAGEKLACLLPGNDLEGAIQTANQIRERIKALQIEHVDSTVEAVVTVSLGIATRCKGSLDTATQLLSQADAQLALAKQRGCNQTAAAL